MIEKNYQGVKKHENNLEKIKKLVLKKCEPKQLLNLELRTTKTRNIPTELIVHSLVSFVNNTS